jgi:pheromone shutdown protein TraB
MENNLETSKARYLATGGILLLATTVYVLYAEPSKLNLAAGFTAIILFGTGTIIGIDKLISLKPERSKKLDGHHWNKKASRKRIAISSIKSTLIMTAVLLFVYYKNGNVDLTLSSWFLILGVYILTAFLSAYVAVENGPTYNDP